MIRMKPAWSGWHSLTMKKPSNYQRSMWVRYRKRLLWHMLSGQRHVKTIISKPFKGRCKKLSTWWSREQIIWATLNSRMMPCWIVMNGVSQLHKSKRFLMHISHSSSRLLLPYAKMRLRSTTQSCTNLLTSANSANLHSTSLRNSVMTSTGGGRMSRYTRSQPTFPVAMCASPPAF
jgi:hypothetical protein